jgi:hypothetical protein
LKSSSKRQFRLPKALFAFAGQIKAQITKPIMIALEVSAISTLCPA